MTVIKHPQQEYLPLEKHNNEQETAISIRYSVIATNRHEAASYILSWYNKSGDTSENRIKDLKIGFSMERIPCGTLVANSIFFRIGVVAYNLFVLFKITSLPQSMQRFQIQTVRWQLYQTAGKVLLPRLNWTVATNKYSKSETANLTQPEKQESKNGGRKNSGLSNNTEIWKKKL